MVESLSVPEVEEFHAYQYLVVARPEPAPDHGTTSIVLLTHNQLGYTRQCLDSIRRRHRRALRVHLRGQRLDRRHAGLPPGCPASPSIVQRREPRVPRRGQPGHRGRARAAGPAAEQRHGRDHRVAAADARALHERPEVGLVGPCSNRVSGAQQVPADYDAPGGLDGFAWDWGKANDGAREETDRLVGFCLLIRRAVVDAIGGLDERFGVGCFEDDDYCLRAARAGYRAVIARDAFVHHYGGRTFVGSGVDFAALMRENERLFRDKWDGGRATGRAAHGGAAAPPAPPARRRSRRTRSRRPAGRRAAAATRRRSGSRCA